MSNAKREMTEVKEEDTPELRVVVSVNGAVKPANLPPPLMLPSRS